MAPPLPITFGAASARGFGLFSLVASPYVVIQTFTASGSWTCPTGVTEVEYLVVAGGGGGGGVGTSSGNAGGGGAGGFRTGTGLSVTAGTTYTITVGGGGSGASAGPNAGSPGTKFFNIGV